MDRFQILCLSGGGFRGLYTASVLAQLENRLDKKVHECFDLICGTSIGGIIATGLAFSCPAQDIKGSLVTNGPVIFKKKSHGLKFWKKFTEAPYQTKVLKQAIEQLLPKEARIRDASVPYITSAINLHTGKPRIFFTPHHERIKVDGNLYAYETALATSAAPLFFPPALVQNERFIDGGLVANAPYLIGLHEAEHFLSVNINKIHILSIGTTGKITGFGHTSKNWGINDWLKNKLIVELTFSAQQDFAANITKHRLNDRFIQIDETHSDHESFSSSMDDASPEVIQQLEGMADRSFMSAITNSAVTDFFEHVPNRTGLTYNFRNKQED
ncbi:MAG: patatin-like phospholipase family protein [Chloroflexi bacterium]|nr:patatin-like phospholipase family protein [Chloroflexota bacterium]